MLNQSDFPEKNALRGVFLWSHQFIAGLGLFLFGLAWLVPNHYPPWLSFHSELVAFSAATCMLIAVLAGSNQAIFLPRICWVALLAVLIAWIQFFLGISPFFGDALTASFYMLGMVGAMAVGFVCNQASAINARHIQLMNVFLLGALLSACIGLAQWLALVDGLDIFVLGIGLGARVSGNLAQPNQLATLLLMGITGLVYAFETSRISKWTFNLALIFMSCMLVLTQSRAGLLSVLFIGCFLYYKNLKVPLKWLRLEIIIWASSIFFLAWQLPYIFEILQIDGSRGVSFTDSSGRLNLWYQFSKGIWEKPWLGYGWNQSTSAQMVGAVALPGDLTVTYAHNLILDLLAWNGIPLGLLFTLLGAWWFVDRIRRVRSLNGVIVMSCLLPLLTHSMLEFPFAYSYFLLPASLLVGAIEAEVSIARHFELNRKMAWGLVLVWCLAGIYFVYEYFLIEEDFRIVRFENMRVGTTPADYAVPEIRMASHMRAMLSAARIQPQPGMPAQQLSALRDVAGRFAYGSLTYRYALALGLNNDPVGASYQMAMIRGLYGESQYQSVKAALKLEADTKYPQLKAVDLP